MNSADMRIEQQLTVLLRRVQRIHMVTGTGDVHLERSSYGILCQLADEGPQRLGALASAFGLDPSTITRQVQALESLELAQRTTDPTDRRASILDLTDEGRDALERTRRHRRDRLQQVLAHWEPADREEFARLLTKFNTSVEELMLADARS